MFAGLFTAMWFSWIGFTLYANRFDTDDVVFRVIKLAATLAIAGCAASATEATGDLGWAFAASFLHGAHLLLAALYVRAWRHVPAARGTISVYLSAAVLSSAFWAASIAMSGTARYVLWAAAVLVDIAAAGARDPPRERRSAAPRAPARALRIARDPRPRRSRRRGRHRRARHALGGRLRLDRGPRLRRRRGAVVELLRRRGAASSAEDLQEREEDEPDGRPPPKSDDVGERHDLFIYGHLPLTLGIAVAGVGVEELVLHPSASLPSPGSWTLAFGVALFFAGAAIIVAGADHRWRTAVPWPAAAIPLVVALGLFPIDSATAVVAIVAAVALVMAVAGTRARRAEA